MSIPFKKIADKWKKDPEFKREYEAREEEYRLARELIAARQRAGLTQAQVARRMKSSQSAVARLESGKTTPSMRTLQKYADATRSKVRFELEPAE